MFIIGLKSKHLLFKQIKYSLTFNGLAPLSAIGSSRFSELLNPLGETAPTSHHWPLGDEGKQARLLGGVSGPPPYPMRVRGGVHFL